MIRLAQVVAVHPSRRTVDLVFLDTGLRVAEAHVLASSAASDAGAWDVPDVDKPSHEDSAGAVGQTPGRKLIAAVAEMAGRPVVLGYLHPLGGQVAFDEANRKVDRHPSGAYETVAPDGSMEWYHPSGTYLRIGTGAHQPLAPLSSHQAWQEVSNAPQPTVTLKTQKMSLVIDPAGNITLTTQGTFSLSAQGTVTLHSDADVVVTGAHIRLN